MSNSPLAQFAFTILILIGGLAVLGGGIAMFEAVPDIGFANAFVIAGSPMLAGLVLIGFGIIGMCVIEMAQGINYLQSVARHEQDERAKAEREAKAPAYQTINGVDVIRSGDGFRVRGQDKFFYSLASVREHIEKTSGG